MKCWLCCDLEPRLLVKRSENGLDWLEWPPSQPASQAQLWCLLHKLGPSPELSWLHPSCHLLNTRVQSLLCSGVHDFLQGSSPTEHLGIMHGLAGIATRPHYDVTAARCPVPPEQVPCASIVCEALDKQNLLCTCEVQLTRMVLAWLLLAAY